MQLEYLYIKNYKVLNNCEVVFIQQQGYPDYYYQYFSNNSFTILVGENGSGKTTLMSFIANLFKNLQRYHDRIKSEFSLKYTIEVNSEEKVVIIEKEIDNVFITVENELPKSVLLEFHLPGRYIVKKNQKSFEYNVTYDEIREFLPSKIVTSVFSMHGEYEEYHHNVKGDRIVENYDVSNIYGLNHYKLTSISKGIHRFLKIYQENKSKVVELLDLLNLKFNNKILVRSRAYSNDYYHLNIGFDNDFDELDEAEKTLKEKFRALDQFIQAHSDINESLIEDEYNENLNVWISVDDDNFNQLLKYEEKELLYLNDLEFDKNGSFISLSNMSSGEKMFFIRILSLLSSVEDNSLIIIEEPELHLNPSWTKQIVTMLQMLFSEYKVHFLISTHSYAFINTVFPENILLATKNKFESPDPNIKTFLANEVEINNMFFENSRKLNYVESILWKKVKEASEKEIEGILGYLGESYTRFKLFNILMDRKGNDENVED